MALPEANDPELRELAKDVAPERVLDRMQATEHKLDDELRADRSRHAIRRSSA